MTQTTPPTVRRALVAEDEGMTVLFLRRALEAAGYTVVETAGDGEEAVRLALETRPEVILMDVNLPRLNGIEATRRIVSAYPVTVIILTAYSQESLVDEAIEAGASAYLVKPVVAEQIAPAVRTAQARFAAFEHLRLENQDLKTTLATRKLVERAKGILMRRLSLSEEDAFLRLQKSARDRSQPMKQAALDVIQADELFREG